MNKRVIVVMEDFPLEGSNGYSTYNLSFIHALIYLGYKPTVIIIGKRLPSIIFSPKKIIQINDHLIDFIFFHAHNLYKDFYILSLPALLKFLLRQFAIYLKNLKALLHPDTSAKYIKKRHVKIGRRITDKQISKVVDKIKMVNPDFILVDTIFRTIPKQLLPSSVKSILIGHDVFYHRCQSLISNGQLPSPFVDQSSELSCLFEYDVIISITETDNQSYQHLSNKLKVVTIYPEVKNTVLRCQTKKQKRILYIGSKAHHNVDGLSWFLSDIWPVIVATHPDVWLDVVGDICHVITNKSKNVIFHGKQEKIENIAEHSIFAINPVRAGAGMKIKMLDYFSFGLPCITTSIGAQGFPEGNSYPILVADNEDDFVTEFSFLLLNPSKCEKLRAAAIAYTQHFQRELFINSFKTVTSILDDRQGA